MHRFKKIIVAVDLADDQRFVSATLPAPTEEAIRQAEWAAKPTNAEIEFFYVLPRPAQQLSHDRQILMAEGDVYKSVFKHAGEVLSRIAERTGQKGIRTKSKVVLGKSWQELIREAIRSDADLVIAGTRRQGPFQSMLFGSTGIKLLRKCPCPVWITKPEPDDDWIDSILVAHDLTAVGDNALEIGATFARARKSDLHVLHAVQRSDSTWQDFSSADDAREKIAKQLTKLGNKKSSVYVNVIDQSPEDAILEYVQKNDIQLVVMGTIARTGVAGMVVGNTAEKLLPFLPCSVLAIKPAEFESPVLLTSDEYEDELARGVETR